MCIHWIFITPAEGCVLTASDRVCVCVWCVCKAHSLIDLVVSQCNRSFRHVVVCKMIDKRTGWRADGVGRVGEAGQSPPIKKSNTIQ